MYRTFITRLLHVPRKPDTKHAATFAHRVNKPKILADSHSPMQHLL